MPMKHIYIITDEAEQFIKIGYSKNPKERLKTLQGKNKNKLKLVASFKYVSVKLIENVIHHLFYEERVIGSLYNAREWYYNRGAVKDFVDVAKNNGLESAIDHVASNYQKPREGWRHYQRDLEKTIEYQDATIGSSSLRT